MGSVLLLLCLAATFGLTLMTRRRLLRRLRILEAYHRKNPWLAIQRDLPMTFSGVRARSSRLSSRY